MIDEIHEADDFQVQLKSVYDFLEVKVLFSGSSAIEITNPDFDLSIISAMKPNVLNPWENLFELINPVWD